MARGTGMLGGTVAFPVPREVAFDYLVDPRNRPEWQSSLARVEQVTGEPRVGQRWVDVTRPGMRPAMETTSLERPLGWSETGRWRGVRADLLLAFDEAPGGCEVTFAFRVRVLGPVGLALTAVSVPAVRADLRSAARLLSTRHDS
ncbi:MAG: SRPBCC family protein [Nocardioides sp.]